MSDGKNDKIMSDPVDEYYLFDHLDFDFLAR